MRLMLILASKDFLTCFYALHDKYIPTKSHKSNSRKLIPKSPWITVSFCKSIDHKNKLYRRYSLSYILLNVIGLILYALQKYINSCNT